MKLIDKIICYLICRATIANRLKEMLGYKTLATLKKRGMLCGDNLLMMNGVILDPSHCWLIEIGNNVILAPNVHVLAHDTSTQSILGYVKIGRVKIGNNCFIGANSVILPGVTIGDNVIVGAGSIVTYDLPDNVVAIGNPCRAIQSREEYADKIRRSFEKSPRFEQEYMFNNITESKKLEMREKLAHSYGFIR